MVYDLRGQLVKVQCYTDLVVHDHVWPHRVVLASLGRDDSSVKAIAVAVVERREMQLLRLDGGYMTTVAAKAATGF